MAAASAAAVSSGDVSDAAGTCQAVVTPKRLPASRRAVASDTNAFGAAPYSFQ